MMFTAPLALFKALLPAIPATPAREKIRAATGVWIGLLICFSLGFAANTYLDARLVPMGPLGATALLIMAIPNSPLAQPWPVVVGNTTAALIGIACVYLLPAEIAPETASALALVTMFALRALHPPAGSVAFLMAINPDHVATHGLWFAAPIGLGSLVLVIVGTIYGRLTGRRYPFRQMPSPAAQTAIQTEARTGLSEDALQELLVRFNQTSNLGAADLGRMIAAAQDEAAKHRFGAITFGEIMSRSPVTVTSNASLSEIIEKLSRGGVKTLPVITPDGQPLGLVSQSSVIAALARSPFPALSAMRAATLMQPAELIVTRDCEVGRKLDILTQSQTPLVVVTEAEDGPLAGVVSRRNVLSLLLPDHAAKEEDDD